MAIHRSPEVIARLHGLTIIAGVLGNELKALSTRVQAFADSPSTNGMSRSLREMNVAATFVGCWGVANFLAVLGELSSRIEAVPPSSVDREEYLDRFRVLKLGIVTLSKHLLDQEAGISVSYASLNDAYARVLRKARPDVISLAPEEIAPMVFMAAAPSLEVDAFWVPEAGAGRTELHSALLGYLASPGADAARLVSRANCYAQLGGLFGAAAAMWDAGVASELSDSLGNEFKRIAGDIESGEPRHSPAPSPEIFSRLLFTLSKAPSDLPSVAAVKRSYGLSRRGSSVLSAHEVAKKFADAMQKFRVSYQQAALTNTPLTILKMLKSIAAESGSIESPAFVSLVGAMQEMTKDWATKPPTEDQWVAGAGVVLLLREAAECWANYDVQDELYEIATGLASSQRLPVCQSLQSFTSAKAISALIENLNTGFSSINLRLETALRTIGAGDLDDAYANATASSLGAELSAYAKEVSGAFNCLDLPIASGFAGLCARHAVAAESWLTKAERVSLVAQYTQLQVFIQRLRPGSVMDMELPEDVQPEDSNERQPAPVEPVAAAAEMTSHELVAAAPVIPGSVSIDAHADELGDLRVPSEAPHQAAMIDEPGQAHQEEAVTPSEFASLLSSDFAVSAVIPDQVLASLAVNPLEVVESAPVQEAEPVVTPAELDQEVLPSSGEDLIASSDDASGAPEDGGSGPREDAQDDGPPGVLEPYAPLPSSPREVPDEQPVSVVVAEGNSLVADYQEADSAGGLDNIFEDDDVDLFGAASAGDEAAVEAMSALGADALFAEFIAAGVGLPSVITSDDEELLSLMFEESWACMEGVEEIFAEVKSGQADLAASLAEARRLIHTLKGVCRTCGLESPGGTLHVMEDRLDVMPSDGLAFKSLLEPFERAMVAIRNQLESIRQSYYASKHSPSQATPPSAQLAQQSAAEVSSADVALEPPPAEAQQEPAVARPAAANLATVRIPVKLAGGLGNNTSRLSAEFRRGEEEVARVVRANRDLEVGLRRVTATLRELEVVAAAGITSSGGATGGGFDPLEMDRYTRMQEVVRQLVEAHGDILSASGALSSSLKGITASVAQQTTLADDIQQSASELLLVPIKTQQTRLEKVLERACLDTGKKAALHIDAASRVPAASLDKLMPVLEHLLRNSIAHGIELPADRIRLGKPESGFVRIGVPSSELAEGGTIRIVVSDDGGGIDLDRVAKIAEKRGLVKSGARLNDDGIRELLFMPGFSTASSVTELAGRGVGLDVVRATLNALGGTVGVDSRAGKGTSFVMTLQTDAATMAVIPVAAGSFRCLVPLTLVRRIVPASVGANVSVNMSEMTASIAGEEYPLLDLASRVPGGRQSAQKDGRGHLILVRESNITRAVLVDSIGAQTRVVVKQLGPFVRDIPGMLAGTTLADGTVSLVVNPIRLQSVAQAPAQTVKKQSRRLAMVIDDSPTVRLLTSRLLTKNGFDVNQATDGLDALQVLARGSVPDVFICDLEMPGMSGFELIEAIRRNPTFASTPIVVVTSRSAEKHRAQAARVGASAYLTKPYEDAELLEIVDSLVKSAARMT